MLAEEQKLICLAEALITRLEQAGAEVDWPEGARVGIGALLRRLVSDVRNRVPLSTRPAYSTIMRGLDHWGISEGDLADDAGAVSDAVRAVILARRDLP